MDDKLREEINRRRTFAIISHPDAGKTTLTEKFLLFGGAIKLKICSVRLDGYREGERYFCYFVCFTVQL